MKKHINRGFTIVELVIVIAVIAILAAVLIPTFANIIEKANTAGDIQLVRNLNMIVAAETAAGNGELSPHGAIVAAAEGGYKVEKITPTSEGRTIVWDAANYRFALLDKDGNEIFPKDEKSGTPKANLFVISDAYPAEGYDGYAVYLTEGYTGGYTLEVTTGVDTGYNEITQITYKGTAEVAIRGWEHSTIQVNSGTVHHYDVADAAYVADGATYVEHGSLNAGQYEGTYVNDSGFAGGQGTPESPYLINDGSQLLLFNNSEDEAAFLSNTKSVHLKLISDVEATGLIWALNGSLDGNGHSITVSESFNSSGYPGIFAEVAGNTVIENVEFVMTNKVYSVVSYNYSDRDASLTLENVTMTAEDTDATYTLKNKRSGLALYQWFGGDLTIKNFVSDLNVDNSAETSRSGVIIGTLMSESTSTATHGNRVVFDGVVYSGTWVSSSFVGFFDGSGGFDGFAPLLVNSPDAPYSTETYTYYANDLCSKCFAAGATSGTVTHDGYCGANWSIDEKVNGEHVPGNPATAVKVVNYYTVCYINNCANEGVIVGNNSNSALYDAYTFCMSTGTPHIANPKKVVAEALTGAQFMRGIMIGADMKVEIANNSNSITFTPDNTGKVDHYAFQANMTFKVTKDGNSSQEGTESLQIALSLTTAEAASFSYKHISQVVCVTDSEEYATLYEQNISNEVVNSDRVSYVMVDNGDGSVMIIAKVATAPGWTVGRNPDRVTYTVVGYDGINMPIAHGSKMVYFD